MNLTAVFTGRREFKAREFFNNEPRGVIKLFTFLIQNLNT